MCNLQIIIFIPTGLLDVDILGLLNCVASLILVLGFLNTVGNYFTVKLKHVHYKTLCQTPTYLSFCSLPDFVGGWNLARIALNDNFACLICFAVASHIHAVHMVQQNKVTHCCPLSAPRAHNHLCVYPKLGIYHTDVPFFGVFATLWEVTFSFVMSISLHGMTHLPLDICSWNLMWGLFENLSRNFKFDYNLTVTTGTLCNDPCTFVIYCWILQRMRNVLSKSCRENQNMSCSIMFLWKLCHLWGNVEKYGGARQTTDDTQNMQFCMPNNQGRNTDTHS